MGKRPDLLAILIVILAASCACVFLGWRTTTLVWTAERPLPRWLEDSLPLRGRWLRIALRVITFPVVTSAYIVIGVPVATYLAYAFLVVFTALGWRWGW